jgi:hypothetical protein
MSEEKKDFVVKDRRIFSQEADDLQQDDDKKEAAASEQQDVEDQDGAAEGASSGEKAAEGDAQDQTAFEDDPGAAQFPEINFPTFVASLNASALVHLGVIEDPATSTKSKNLPMAKQTIDILSMLEEKTTGNLSPDEKSMLQNVLYDLRIMYVKEKS